MKHFKISGFYGDTPVLITDSNQLSGAATFDETFTIEKHSKSTLNFRISDMLDNGQPNPYMGLVYPGAKLQLEVEDGASYKTIWYKITSKSPEFYQNLNIYSISCEDFASQVWAKEAQGFYLDNTGTLKELLQEILVKSRKNLGYRGLIKNYLDFSKYSGSTGTPVLTTTGLSKNFTIPDAIGIVFNRVKDMPAGNYIVSMNMLSAPSGTTSFTIQQRDPNGNQLSNTTAVNKTAAGLVEIPFNLIQGTASYKITVSTTGTGLLSLVDWKTKRNITDFTALINTSLKIAPTFNEENFKGALGDYSYYKKATLSLDNTNLYNALIELANLFDAEIVPSYTANTVNFINNSTNTTYKGYTLSPDFNLMSLNRTESTEEHGSVLQVISNDNVYSILPPTPAEWKQYFYDCIKNDFRSPWFETYSTNGYQTAATQVKTYIAPTEDIAARSKIIDDFAIAADKVPNFDNTLYSLDYYLNIGAITQLQYDTFKSLVNNDLRKQNIRLKILGEMYQNAVSQLSAKETEIDFVSRNLVVENLLLNDLIMELAGLNTNSEDWIPIKNRYDACQDQIYDYTQQLMLAMNILYDIDLVPTGIEVDEQTGRRILATDSYTLLLLIVYGFYNIYKNGVRQRIDEVRDEITRLANLKAEYAARIQVLDGYLNLTTITNFNKIEYEVEKSGLEAARDAMVYEIGQYTNDVFTPVTKGSLHYKLMYLNNIVTFLGNKLFKATLIDYFPWKVNDPTEAFWTWTGTVNTSLISNMYTNNDLMMSITTTGTITSSNIVLVDGRYYRATGLFKIAANSSGTLGVRINANTPFSLTYTSVASDRWFAFEYYIGGDKPSDYYLYPSEVKFNATSVAPITTFIAGTGNSITYSFTGTGSVYLYRPRLEEVLPRIPLLSDVYYLYDNPIMNGFVPSGTALDLDTMEALYDILYNENYDGNANVAKQEIINQFYNEYENFVIERYFENSDEITSEGLLEQALLAFALTKYPRVDYGVSIIDMAALADWKFLNLNVGDKIKISPEHEDRLYLSYQDEATKYLQVSQISYNLRQPESTSLTIAQDDETQNILQKILKQL